MSAVPKPLTLHQENASLHEMVDRLEGESQRLRAKLKAFAPYPQHCCQAELCAGLRNCPRDPVCIE